MHRARGPPLQPAEAVCPCSAFRDSAWRVGNGSTNQNRPATPFPVVDGLSKNTDMNEIAIDPILDSLNVEQRNAVLAKDGPILIVAGAGSGKTRVLTSRIALLLREGIDPRSILALAFTKKAAGELRSRIGRLLGEDQAARLVTGTFHSVFVRFLRERHDLIGFPRNFTIYDADDAESCLKDCIAETLFGPSWNDREARRELTEDERKRRRELQNLYRARDVASRISRLKNDYITPKEYLADPAFVRGDELRRRPLLGNIYDLYMKRCRRAGAMDFDDILVYMYFLLERFPDVARDIAGRFHYILVDEYQDTNALQYAIVRTLATAHGNICAVGDDSQSIYAFRGARIENILNFRADFPRCRQFKLETNYRSTPQIVEAANRLIGNNGSRIPKRCTAFRGAGVPVRVERLGNDREEARYIATCIRSFHDDEGMPYSGNAVLYRTNAQARALEDALLREQIPYVIYSGMSFFERQEVKDVLAYLRLTVNPDDDEAFKRVCNRPAKGFGDQTLSLLSAEASRTGKSLLATAEETLSIPGFFRPSAEKAVGAFVRQVRLMFSETQDMDALECARHVLQASGLYEFYSAYEDDGRRRTENIDELLNGIGSYLEDQLSGNTVDLPDPTIGGYLENVSLLSAADRHDGDVEDKVVLMTSHSSKGLEFPTVFVAGVEEGLYPALRDGSTAFDLEEERRLFYVSVTRARDRLVLTCCRERWKYGESTPCAPSRFIDEMLQDD